jgi:CubicO group peptidase (beta-lactamase class C family)
MRRRRFISLLGGAALAPFAASRAGANQPGGCDIPVAQDDGWPVATTNEKLIDRDALCGMADRLATSSNVHAVVAARSAKLVFERYFSGDEQVPARPYGHRIENVRFDADTLHNMKSASKSVLSLAVGIAVDRGLIRSVNQPIFDFFPELSDLRSQEKDRIQLVHVLTMSMGLKWVEATPATGDDDNDEARMHMASDQCRYVLGLPVTAPAGQEFFYNTGALALVSAVLRKATGLPLDEFIRVNLFEPLGITHAEWERYKGEVDAGGGLHLRPRDMAKLGQLVLAGGRWNDRQVASKEWIDISTTAKLKASDNQSYGYLWWLGRARLNGREIQWIGALGRGGQYIRIVPELDLVVAVTGGYYEDYSKQAFQVQFGVFRDVLRAALSPG